MKNIKHINRAIKSRGTKLDKKIKLKKNQTLKNIKSQININ
jgi:hypothetical protein